MRNRQSSVTMDTQYPVMSNGARAFAVGGGCGAAPRAPCPYAPAVTRATASAVFANKTNLLILRFPRSKTYFKANCMILGLSELRIWPKTLLVNTAFTPPTGQLPPTAPVVPEGQPGRKLFKMLYASARNSNRWLSRNGNARDSPMSRDQVPGPVRLLRPTFPTVPTSGREKAAGLIHRLSGRPERSR